MEVDQTKEAVTMKVDQKRRWKIFLVAGATLALVAGMVSTVPSAYAGGTIMEVTHIQAGRADTFAPVSALLA